MKKFKLFLGFLVLWTLVFAVIYSSCASTTTPVPTTETLVKTHLVDVITVLPHRGVSVNLPETHHEPCMRPVRIGLLLDISSSMVEFGITLPTRADVELLTSLIKRCGGEIGVGSIQVDASARLIRLRLEIPETPVTEPQRKDYPNAFAFAEEKRSFKQRFDAYEERRKEREAQTTLLVRDFLDQVDLLLQKAATAGRSDVWGSIKRGATFLGEDPLSWPNQPRAYLALVSDGHHNRTGQHHEKLDPAITILIAHGTSDLGALNTLKPVPHRFESARAMFRFILSNAQQ